MKATFFYHHSFPISPQPKDPLCTVVDFHAADSTALPNVFAYQQPSRYNGQKDGVWIFARPLDGVCVPEQLQQNGRTGKMGTIGGLTDSPPRPAPRKEVATGTVAAAGGAGVVLPATSSAGASKSSSKSSVGTSEDSSTPVHGAAATVVVM